MASSLRVTATQRPSDDPVKGVKVTVASTAGVQLAEATTDDAGEVTLSGLPTGEVNLFATWPDDVVPVENSLFQNVLLEDGVNLLQIVGVKAVVPSAGDRDAESDRWWREKALQSGGFLLGYWVLGMVLPLRWDLWLGLAFGIGGTLLMKRALDLGDPPARRTRLSVSYAVLVLGLALVGNGLLNRDPMFQVSQDPQSSVPIRMGLVVGGTAVVVLVVAAARYISVKAAVSMPVVVLLVALVAFPEARTLVGEDLSKQIVAWMSAILGVAAVAEAAENGKKAQETAKVKDAGIAALSSTAQDQTLPEAARSEAATRLASMDLSSNSTARGNPSPSDF